MKFTLSNGKFVCKENADAPIILTAITGILVGLRIIRPEGQKAKVQLDLKDVDENGESVVRTLNLRLYGNPAFKVLRSLYGIAEILADKKITISAETPDGYDSAVITVYADNERLPVCGDINTSFSGEMVMMIDRAVATLSRCFEFRKNVLVYANADGVYSGFGLDTTAVVDYIRDLRRSGRSGELTVVKTAFTNPATAKGYLKALRDLSATRAFRYTDNDTDIDAIWSAYTEELPETPADGTDAGSAADDDEDY